MSENNPSDDTFLNRLQNYISTLELSNSELETQLQSLKKDLSSSNSLAQQLHSNNVGILDHSNELESRQRLLDTFLGLRNQEKEIFIKNIELFLSRLQKLHAEESTQSQQLEKLKTESSFLRVRLQELEFDNARLQESNLMLVTTSNKEKTFWDTQKNELENEISKEKEKNNELMKRLTQHEQEFEMVKTRERNQNEEQKRLENIVVILQENIKRLETLVIKKSEDLERASSGFERDIERYQDELKPVIESLDQLTIDTREKEEVIVQLETENTKLKQEMEEHKKDYEAKIQELNEELRSYRNDQVMMQSMAMQNLETIKQMDLLDVIQRLQKGYMTERSRAINSSQTLRSLKSELEKKLALLYEKFIEWEDFQKKHQKLIKTLETLSLKVRDLEREKAEMKLTLKEEKRRTESIELEKKELIWSFERIADKDVKGIVERNMEMKRQLEEIYQNEYSQL